MHSVCLGVVRYLILLWISPIYHKEPWYLGKKEIGKLNEYLSCTKPPYDITRTPRTLDSIKYWKASEFRAFLLFYFPLLEGVLPDPYFSHLKNLSYSIFVLLQENVPNHSVSHVGIILQNMVKKAELLYGEQMSPTWIYSRTCPKACWIGVAYGPLQHSYLNGLMISCNLFLMKRIYRPNGKICSFPQLCSK